MYTVCLAYHVTERGKPTYFERSTTADNLDWKLLSEWIGRMPFVYKHQYTVTYSSLPHLQCQVWALGT